MKDICERYHTEMRDMYAVLPSIRADEETPELLEKYLYHLYQHARCCKVCDHNRCPILFGLGEISHKEDLTKCMLYFTDLIIYHLDNCPHCGGFR